MSHYHSDGTRRCEGCADGVATTRRKHAWAWYSVCEECAADYDRRKKATKEREKASRKAV